MALYSASDLTNVQDAIRALSIGAREVEVTIGAKKVRYAEADLNVLLNLQTIIRQDLGQIVSRTYAKNAGRASC